MMRLLIIALFFCHYLLFAGELKPDLTVHIPMRDGVSLPTDIYLPTEGAKGLPCVLIRSPAGRASPPARIFASLARAGYVVAIQDTRSFIDPEGKTFPYHSDSWSRGRDGHETIEWLAKNPLTNGKIGTLGFSALGITQILLAPDAPQALKCQYIGVAPPSVYHYAVVRSGKLLKHQVESWLGYYAHDSGVCTFVSNQLYNEDFWMDFDTRHAAGRVNIPAIHQGGWFDTFLQGSIDAFLFRQEHGGEGARGKQKLVIGPWMHFWPLVAKLGDFEVPVQGRSPPYDLSPLRWFDFYLKDNPNGIDQIPAVTYYVMGPFDGTPSSGNVWKTADRWPVESQKTSFYLSANQQLTEGQPAKSEGSLAYAHDPADPVPTLGGLNLFLESGPVDQRPIESRPDVLVFNTLPLEEDLEVTGRIIAKVFISSDCHDTDVAVRLCDVYPDGRSILIGDGIHRTGLAAEENKPEEPCEVEVDLWSTSIVFAEGHRIRISIAGSNFPRYENNLNIGVLGTHANTWAIAHNKVHIGGRFPSRIILPLVRRGNRQLAQNTSQSP